jgi:predicted transcriptional regulator
MKPDEASILDDLSDADDKARFERALADIAQGRVVPHDEVKAWLQTWGQPDAPPPPAHWFK